MPFYLSDTASKLAIIKAVEADQSVHLIHFKEGLLESKWHTLLKLISIVTYFGLSIHTYLKVKGKIKTDIIVDYNRIFSFLKLYLITRFAAIVLILTAFLFFRSTPSFAILLQNVNLFFLVNVFVLIFGFPEFIYGESIHTAGSGERESLVKTLMSQTVNLRLLQKISHEANVLFDSQCRLMYFNKQAERMFKAIYGIEIELNADFRQYLDPASAGIFQSWFNRCLQGETIQIEEKFLLHDNSDFTWLHISFTAHYNELGKLKGVSAGANTIDDKKRMAQLQEKYVQRLDELAWDCSHLLRAPVANMKGIVGLIAQREIQLSREEKEQLISHMSDELDDLDNVIREMVEKARKELAK
jgi:PAS domain-containing protein